MRELVSYMFTSLDGFIADRGGDLNWAPIDDQLMRFANEYFASADGIVFGRNVYDEFVSYWDGLDPNQPSVSELDVEFAEIFGKMNRIVASTTLGAVDGRTFVINDDVPGRISALKQEPGRDLLLICGPELRSTLTRLGLVDRHRSDACSGRPGDGQAALRRAGGAPSSQAGGHSGVRWRGRDARLRTGMRMAPITQERS